ncbi:hypothetical protein COCON_G00148200 [Conger conger]|uniref:Uncharacterized protein n=1 Tax=Conger conger TaxID=82655 RepID=A0A9Q1DC43_CONCO|nr:hypothetical protein COCON_G00148200 [Conger conger]
MHFIYESFAFQCMAKIRILAFGATNIVHTVDRWFEYESCSQEYQPHTVPGQMCIYLSVCFLHRTMLCHGTYSNNWIGKRVFCTQ